MPCFRLRQRRLVGVLLCTAGALLGEIEIRESASERLRIIPETLEWNIVGGPSVPGLRFISFLWRHVAPYII
ncbi:hypothetical protein I7I50_08333 [Histoplasma capsulatum G186AR]|uniref:Uncharacterized protein n=1 Tax=Ajellomyces capsulatus TaxID=5037 RepID=A0A8H7YQQ5_AJECA|nr:hypothetical protein I7I52_05849 [Histoplasma capsulatum]QSS73532.1 hypothetical protein I7I50_08333 [Histoplasma capsulatum G186AR]